METKKLRKAIAMIELIFSIVIMGIALLSAPMLVSTASKSSQVTFQQESVAAIASHTNAIMSYAWDEQNTESQLHFGILDTASTTTVLTNRTELADALSTGKKRTYDSPHYSASAADSFGKDKDLDPGTTDTELVPDDIDDFHDINTSLTLANNAANSASTGDYMDTLIKITTKVRYIGDTSSSADFSTCQNAGNGCAFSITDTNNIPAVGGTTNIKWITTTLTSSNVPDKNIVLHAFMCNIGTATPTSRPSI